MAGELVCWKCGAPFGDLPLPLSRFSECRQCRTRLHACRQCRFYDTGVAKQCREPVAEEVKDKTRANFCDWFQPAADAWQPPDRAARARSRGELEALFGMQPGSTQEAPGSTEEARARLDDLFRK